jgi:glycerol-3-phosphate O-acyltransferase 3/4
MKNHIQRAGVSSPLLIFPEGTCVNNNYTVLFHKGAFDLDCLICPVAIRYDKTFGDPYWMSSKQTFLGHVLYLMTRWALVADVWWLPPQKIKQDESAASFAYRVKTLISDQARLKSLDWDGYMKNYFTGIFGF